jgi:hypothetical protein
VFKALAKFLRGFEPQTTNTHRLQHGLPGYLILFAPRALVPQRQYHPRSSPSLLMFLRIFMDITPTLEIPRSPSVLKFNGFESKKKVTSSFHHQPNEPPTYSLRPVNPKNACPSRLTAAAGTELAGASFPGNVFFFPGERSLQPISLPSSTRDRWIRVPPIVQYSALLPSSLVWVFSHPQCG